MPEGLEGWKEGRQAQLAPKLLHKDRIQNMQGVRKQLKIAAHASWNSVYLDKNWKGCICCDGSPGFEFHVSSAEFVYSENGDEIWKTHF